MSPVLGFDVGGTKCAAVLGEALPDGRVSVLARRAFATAETVAPRPTLERLCAVADELLRAHGCAPPEAIGVSCGGPLDRARGMILSPPNLPGWDRVPVVDILGSPWGVPTVVENDANAAALAEWWWGAGRGARDLVFLTLGTGLGAGLILDGRLYRGASDLAGEVGHVRLAPDGPIGHGKRGSFEGFCSGGGLARRLRAMGDLGSDPRALCERSATGDPAARAVIDELGARLGEGLAIIVDVLNPERIVLGGLFTRHPELLRPSLERRLAEEALAPALAACRLVPSAFGEEVGDHAALAVAHQAAGAGSFSACARAAATTLTGLEALQPDLSAAAATLLRCLGGGHKVLVCGNGGSSAEAQHLVGELMGRYRGNRRSLPAVHLGGDLCLMSCVGNDFGWEQTFSRPLQALARPGDLLICFSTSGRSQNVVRALTEARVLGIDSLALLGGDGAESRALATQAIVVPVADTARIQEAHLLIVHWLCDRVEDAFV